jgi:alpha/beta superfamily hydrolase
LFGGNMDNNVVLAVSHGLVERGFVTLRFNFRGVGNSEGEHSKGEQESEEVLAALDLMKAWPGVDSKRIGLAGYSFGSSVVLGNASLHKKAKAIALISPPLRAVESTPLKKGKQPTFIITGDRDKLVQSDQLDSVLDAFSQKPGVCIVAGADHFWAGHENEMVPEVVKHFSEHLK